MTPSDASSELRSWIGEGQLNRRTALAIAMGFTSADALSSEAWALWKQIEVGEPLAPEDWRRVLLAVEIVFASDVVGSGLDWHITSGIPDDESIRLLRGLQRKLPRWRGSVQFTVDVSGGVEVTDPDRSDP